MTDLLDRLRAATNDPDKLEAAKEIQELQAALDRGEDVLKEQIRQEREACARLVESLEAGLPNSEIAALIRARG